MFTGFATVAVAVAAGGRVVVVHGHRDRVDVPRGARQSEGGVRLVGGDVDVLRAGATDGEVVAGGAAAEAGSADLAVLPERHADAVVRGVGALPGEHPALTRDDQVRDVGADVEVGRGPAVVSGVRRLVPRDLAQGLDTVRQAVPEDRPHVAATDGRVLEVGVDDALLHQTLVDARSAVDVRGHALSDDIVTVTVAVRVDPGGRRGHLHVLDDREVAVAVGVDSLDPVTGNEVGRHAAPADAAGVVDLGEAVELQVGRERHRACGADLDTVPDHADVHLSADAVAADPEEVPHGEDLDRLRGGHRQYVGVGRAGNADQADARHDRRKDGRDRAARGPAGGVALQGGRGGATDCAVRLPPPER